MHEWSEDLAKVTCSGVSSTIGTVYKQELETIMIA